MSHSERILSRLVFLGGVLAALGVVATVVAGLTWPQAFFHAYLAGFVFWIGLPLGAGVLLMIGATTGGRWVRAIEEPAEAALVTLPVLALTILPLAWGLEELYPWAREALVEEVEVLRHRQAYMNEAFVLGRAALFLVVWSLGGLLLASWSRRIRALRARGAGAEERRLAGRLSALAAAGLVTYVLTESFAAIDWVLSLSTHFYSTIFGLYVGVGQVITGMALVTLYAAWRTRRAELAGDPAGAGRELYDRDLLQDLGKILLTFVVLHGYFAFSQWLVVWFGNKEHEIAWHVPRLKDGWYHLATAIVALQLAVPFVALLFRRVKRSPGALAALSLTLLTIHLADVLWMVLPSDDASSRLALGVLSAAAPLALGGLWLALFATSLRRRLGAAGPAARTLGPAGEASA